MSLYDELMEWAESRPWWQQRLLAQFASGERLSTDAYAEIARSLLAPTPAAPHGGWLSRVRSPAAPADTSNNQVVLNCLREVRNVNRLRADERLTFGRHGVTVVFGFNGSGKSGYARLIKQMVRTRHHETILPDVFGDVRQEREGFLDYSVGDVSDEADLADAPPLPLGRVTFYDEKCGDAYLTTESEISYRPSALTLLDDLYEACEGVRRELDRMLAENDRAGVRLPAFESGSPSAVFADTLTWDTSDEQIETACRLPADHADEMVRLQTEESRLRSTDPSKEQARFRRVAADVKTVVAHLMSLEDRLGAESVAELRSRQSAAQGLRGSAGVWVIVRR